MTDWQNLEGTAEFNRGYRTTTVPWYEKYAARYDEVAPVDAPPLLPPPPPAPELFDVRGITHKGNPVVIVEDVTTTDFDGDTLHCVLADGGRAFVNTRHFQVVVIDPETS